MSRNPEERREVFNEINITPLTDIFLVLLIIMMVVAPMMQSVDATIKPPTVEGGSGIEQGKLTVEVSAEGKYAVDGEPVEADGLVAALERRSTERGMDEEEEKNLIIRADAKTRSAAVLTVFEAARDAKFHKVTVAGEKPDSGSRIDVDGAGAATDSGAPDFSEILGDDS